MSWLSRAAERRRWSRWRRDGLEVVHLLHIGKTGGTAVRAALAAHTEPEGRRLVFHGHGFRFEDAPPGDRVVFFLRDPVTRFVSGFNSRLRKGRPRYDVPWTDAEARAFGRFTTAQDLALALSSDDAEEKAAAEDAMRGIQHVNAPFAYWLRGVGYLDERRDDVLLVGFQESLARDVERLRERLDLPRDVALPTDDVSAHRTPGGAETGLSDEARANLRDWYADDLAILAHCRALAGVATA